MDDARIGRCGGVSGVVVGTQDEDEDAQAGGQTVCINEETSLLIQNLSSHILS